jgi:REP element-mobilizing transposase RayT
MSRKYKFNDPGGTYFISYATVNWIDLFTRNEYRNVILESLEFCQREKGLRLFGWCIMTNHVHLLAATDKEPLEKIMRDHKRHTSIELRDTITNYPAESRREWILWMMQRAGKKNSNNMDWQLWRQDNHPILISDADMLAQKLAYIHNNPVEAGFVAHPEDYLYSSAIDYAGGKGLLPVEVLELIKIN